MATIYVKPRRPAKYRNRKVTVDGMVFDSAREHRFYCHLALGKKAGVITDIRRQVEFVLVPKQVTWETVKTKRGKEKQRAVLVERQLAYVADFVVTQADGQVIVYDVKGVRTEAYIIKRKLMFWVHKIRVVEI